MLSQTIREPRYPDQEQVEGNEEEDYWHDDNESNRKEYVTTERVCHLRANVVIAPAAVTCYWTHKTPTETVIASLALHFNTTSVFLNSYCTPGTFSDVFHKSETCKCTLLLVTALSFVPRLVTFKAGILATVRALKFMTFSSSSDIFLTLNVGTPDHIWVSVDLTGKSESL